MLYHRPQSLETPTIRFSPFPERCSVRFFQRNIFETPASCAIGQCLFCSTLGKPVLKTGAIFFPHLEKWWSSFHLFKTHYYGFRIYMPYWIRSSTETTSTSWSIKEQIFNSSGDHKPANVHKTNSCWQNLEEYELLNRSSSWAWPCFEHVINPILFPLSSSSSSCDSHDSSMIALGKK